MGYTGKTSKVFLFAFSLEKLKRQTGGHRRSHMKAQDCS